MQDQGPAPRERLIKRYPNRKLYDAQAGRYVTVEDLARAVGQGEEIRVVDQRTGHDLTTVVLAQVILEGQKQRPASIPHQVLSHLVRLAHGPRSAWAEWTGPGEAAGRAREEAERIVSGLLGRGRLTLDEALALRHEMAGAVQRIVADAQEGLEAKMHGLLARSQAEAGVNPSLLALKTRLRSFEELIASPPPAGPVRRAGSASSRGRSAATKSRDQKSQSPKRRK